VFVSGAGGGKGKPPPAEECHIERCAAFDGVSQWTLTHGVARRQGVAVPFGVVRRREHAAAVRYTVGPIDALTGKRVSGKELGSVDWF
jgi:hypothetical protein